MSKRRRPTATPGELRQQRCWRCGVVVASQDDQPSNVFCTRCRSELRTERTQRRHSLRLSEPDIPPPQGPSVTRGASSCANCLRLSECRDVLSPGAPLPCQPCYGCPHYGAPCSGYYHEYERFPCDDGLGSGAPALQVTGLRGVWVTAWDGAAWTGCPSREWSRMQQNGNRY